MTDLLPCPFCGSSDVGLAEDDYYFCISCADCLADGPIVDVDGYDERYNASARPLLIAKAVEAWNRRALSPP